MKTLRYLLIMGIVLLMPVASVMAQYSNQRQQNTFGQTQSASTDFRSTSTMQGSGSGISIAAQSGVVLSGNTPGESTPVGHPGSSRRATKDDDPWGGGDIGGVDKPEEPGTPLGDGLWALMLLAFGLLCYRMVRGTIKRTTASALPNATSIGRVGDPGKKY